MNCEITNYELEKIYCVKQVRLGSFDCRKDMDCRIIYDTDNISYFFDLILNGTSILEQPMHITFCCNENEKVVKLEYVRFIDAIKGSEEKYYSKMHDNELEIYDEKGFSRIFLSAIADGIIVWPRLGYQFINPSEEAIVFEAIEIYVNQVKGIEAFDIDDYDTIKEIDIDYLRDKDKQDFTEWFEIKGHSLQPAMELEI